MVGIAVFMELCLFGSLSLTYTYALYTVRTALECDSDMQVYAMWRDVCVCVCV